MRLIFLPTGWEDYVECQRDAKLLRKLNGLLKECSRHPFEGSGKPEPLKHDLAGWWSRRITEEHRLVYRVEGDDLVVAQCRYHY